MGRSDVSYKAVISHLQSEIKERKRVLKATYSKIEQERLRLEILKLQEMILKLKSAPDTLFNPYTRGY